MGREEPAFDGDENLATYEAARHLVRRSLENGLHVVHDATNLRERDRRASYVLADELEAPVRVLFVDAPRSVLEARAEREGPAARQALDALGDRNADPATCPRPHLVLDGTRPPTDNVDTVLAAEGFELLQRTAKA
jgi:predicted kinase